MLNFNLLQNKIVKISRFFLVFVLISGWVFSGWPQIYNFPPKIQKTYAFTCAAAGFTDIGGGVCRGFITTTGAGTFTIPSDWTNINQIQVIGGGGAGGLQATDASAGGGGGAYSTVSNLTGLTGNIDLSVGVGGTPSATQSVTNGGDTWFGNTTCTTAQVCAGGGVGALDESPAGTGGVAAQGTADTGSNGGAGGTSGTAADDGGGGGGGAGGPGGVGGNGGAASDNGGAGGGGAGKATPANGANSTTATGGAGGDGPGGGGGVVPGGAGTADTGGGGAGGTQTTTEAGGDGATGSEWGSGKGAGGGGGGAADAGAGGNGGLYGGGGAGQGEDSAGTKMLGGQGIIIISYTLTASAALTGTVTASITEADIVTGGKTIILTLTNDTWVAVGATFDAQRQNIINGIDSAQAEGTGWDAEVKAKEVVGAVVRTSDSVVTITLTAQAGYNITATETITATIPATALVRAVAIVATPTFTVTAVGLSTTILIRNVADTADVATITFPAGNPSAVISNPTGNTDVQVLTATETEAAPVALLTSTAAYTLWYNVTSTSTWGDAVASEKLYVIALAGNLNLTTFGTNAYNMTTWGTDQETTQTLAAGVDKELYLQVTLSALWGKTGTSTLSVLGEAL